jgi:hypothetical protein
MLGPPLGGLAIGVLGPAATMVADAAGYRLSAAGLRAIGVPEPPPPPGTPGPLRAGDLLDGWRSILALPGGEAEAAEHQQRQRVWRARWRRGRSPAARRSPR